MCSGAYQIHFAKNRQPFGQLPPRTTSHLLFRSMHGKHELIPR
jgi:hypothetical protein